MFKRLTKFPARAICARVANNLSILVTGFAIMTLTIAGLYSSKALTAYAKSATQDPAPAKTRKLHDLDKLVVRDIGDDTKLIIAISDTGSVAIQVIRPTKVTVER